MAFAATSAPFGSGATFRPTASSPVSPSTSGARAVHGIGRLLVVLFLLLPATIRAEPPPPRDAANEAFWWRYDNRPLGEAALDPPREWYRPLGKISGAGDKPFLPVVEPDKAGIDKAALAAAADYVGATHGEALIVLHKGKVALERYFDGKDAQTTFSSHSLAKTLNALAIGAAMQDGFIPSLDTAAERWLPEWRGDTRRTITIRNLLEMSGGFQASFSEDPGSRYIQGYYGADVEKLVRDAPMVFEPGTRWAYDGDNNHALGLIIERATGRPYKDYVGSRVWRRVGADDAEVLLDHAGGRAMAYCCILSRPRDWARLGQLMLADGKWGNDRILPPGFVAEMRKPSAANPNFGLQLFLGSSWLNPQINRRVDSMRATLAPAVSESIFHAAGAGGIQLMVAPEADLVILRVGKAHKGWRDQVLINTLLPAVHSDARPPVAAADWHWLAGFRTSLLDMRAPATLENNPALFWPTETVAGGHAQPLPRRSDQCFTADRLQAALAETRRTNSSSFMIWRKGAVVFEEHKPGAAARHAESASMHKTVLAMAIGQAVAAGFIPDLDAPVGQWLSEWANDPRGSITVRQMLQMASGLNPALTDAARQQAVFGSDFARAALETPLKDAPGSRFNYLGAAPQLLATVLERATGQRYASFVSSHLWQKLGAADAFVALDRPGGVARTSASLLAVPEDWMRLGVLLAGKGKWHGKAVMTPEWWSAMTAPSPANPNYGFQIWRASPSLPFRRYNDATLLGVKASQPFAIADMVYLDGALAQRVYASASQDLVIVRLGANAIDWDDALVPNLVAGALANCEHRR